MTFVGGVKSGLRGSEVDLTLTRGFSCICTAMNIRPYRIIKVAGESVSALHALTRRGGTITINRVKLSCRCSRPLPRRRQL